MGQHAAAERDDDDDDRLPPLNPLLQEPALLAGTILAECGLKLTESPCAIAAAWAVALLELGHDRAFAVATGHAVAGAHAELALCQGESPLLRLLRERGGGGSRSS